MGCHGSVFVLTNAAVAEESLSSLPFHQVSHRSNTSSFPDNLGDADGSHSRYNNINASVSLQREHRYIKRRNLSFYSRNGRNYYYKSKSHSLNAILEELYSFGADRGAQEERTQVGGSKIPRIKLKGNTSNLREEKNYRALRKMSSESEIFFGDTTNLHKRLNNDLNANIPDGTTNVIISDQGYDQISKKSDDNYFTKNFDDCMKRLEVIEKELNLIENVDDDREFCKLSQADSSGEMVENSECGSEKEFKNFENGPAAQEKIFDNYESTANRYENFGKAQNVDVDAEQNSVATITITTTPPEKDAIQMQENKESISDWYSNLKQQFEKREQEKQEIRVKEMSCRITGATLKSQNEKNKSEDKEKDTRHYFSKLVKANRSLVDEELPDPDKVKHIRAMFQETLNSTLKRKLDKKLGGSLQNISCRAAEQQTTRPLSAQCCRNDLFGEMDCSQRQNDKKDVDSCAKEVSKPLRDGIKDVEIENTKKKLFEKYERELKPGKEYRCKRIMQPKWTDTGSVSSGVSSDLSSYDTDLESYSREGTEQDEMTISDDDLLEEVKDKHYVQNEVLEKIRSYGTSVTYYGGEMLTCSVGPLLSPTTQAIMEEIGEMYGHETNPARSFDEFYRKYIETNEHNRKKKVGRTRSFGQSDVFQKPNVLSNSEIDFYKNDLEIEIGIKKPMGIPQNSLKRKVTKSASLGSGMQVTEKARETSSPVMNPTEADVLEKSTAEEVKKENDVISNNTTENVTSPTEPEQKLDEKKQEINGEAEEEKPENKETEEATEMKKSCSEKEYVRSKSAPEGLSMQKIYEMTSSNFNSPAKEIYFSYEKSLFNGKPISDMEFEEFEVCESPSEKLEKLEKQNTENSKMAAATDESSDSQLEKRFEEATKGEFDLGLRSASAVGQAEKLETGESFLSSKGRNESNQREKKESKYNHSRWPIETTVMVDIQKEDEQTPKIITSQKTLAKTKVRLF